MPEYFVLYRRSEGRHIAEIGKVPYRVTGDLCAIIGVPPWKSSIALPRRSRGHRSCRTGCMAISESLLRAGGVPPGWGCEIGAGEEKGGGIRSTQKP